MICKDTLSPLTNIILQADKSNGLKNKMHKHDSLLPEHFSQKIKFRDVTPNTNKNAHYKNTRHESEGNITP